MTPQFDIRPVAVSIPSHRRDLESMLQRNGLRLEQVDCYLGIYDGNDTLLGGGGLAGNVIKCVAIDESLRGENLTNSLISQLRSMARSEGHRDIFIYTKPENEVLFSSLAFHTVGRAPKAVLMESNPRGLSSYCNMLSRHRRPGKSGVIVMNCNPMTLGHEALIDHSRKLVDHLFVIIVAEDKSEYSFAERYDMVRAQMAGRDNITVLPGSAYSISTATFPSYFLKRVDDATETSILLDLDIFGQSVAKALDISVRFAGSEPTDALTAKYNELMATVLPKYGVEFVQMERIAVGSRPVSASHVRNLTDEGKIADAAALLPKESKAALLAHIAADMMRRELRLTPKPGLVDRHDNGAHQDMDYKLMSASIEAITPGMRRLARLALDKEVDVHSLQIQGQKIEKDMFEATGGVNTHKGAVFAFSLAVAATAKMLNADVALTSEKLSHEISIIARDLHCTSVDTHGASAVRQYKVHGAMDNAITGYRQLVDSWLPYYRNVKHEENAELKTLLLIMSEIDDTNVLHRTGLDGAIMLRQTASDTLTDFSLERVRRLNDAFKKHNISPGGAADMLALTLYFDKITS